MTAVYPSRRDFIASTILGAAACRALSASPATTTASSDRFPFYAMDTGLRGPDVPTLQDKVRLLRELGYWGIDYALNHSELPRLLELLDGEVIQLACVYLSPSLEENPDPRLRESIGRLKGRATRIELAIRSRTLKPSDSAGDGQAQDLIRRISDWAADSGPLISIYPHTGLWTERVQDGVRLAQNSGRQNVGANFNLVHWSWVKQDDPLEAVLKAALPHLFAVSINGLAGRRIVPLGEGDYDVTAFLRLVQKIGYRGPIGFQGYGVPGPSRDLLQKSITSWREILTKLDPAERQ